MSLRLAQRIGFLAPAVAPRSAEQAPPSIHPDTVRERPSGRYAFIAARSLAKHAHPADVAPAPVEAAPTTDRCPPSEPLSEREKARLMVSVDVIDASGRQR